MRHFINGSSRKFWKILLVSFSTKNVLYIDINNIKPIPFTKSKSNKPKSENILKKVMHGPCNNRIN